MYLLTLSMSVPLTLPTSPPPALYTFTCDFYGRETWNKVVGSSRRLYWAVWRWTATGLKISKVREFPVDSRYESASLRIPRKGGTGSISGVGVLLWPGKPILCGL